jgi:4-hydroxybenzoate polyprenyltransferase
VREASDQEETDVAGGTEEIVTSPDQHKPGPKKAAYIGAFASIVILLLMLLGNHHGRVENLWLVGVAVLLLVVLVADWMLRKNGIKRSE